MDPDPADEQPARRLVTGALDAAEDAETVLLGGLGDGLGLDEALRHESVAAVTVVESQETVVDWNRTHLGTVALDDPRVEIVVDELVRWIPRTDQRFDAVCLNGGAESLFESTDAVLTRLSDLLTDGGVLALRSEQPDDRLADRLADRFDTTWTVNVPVPLGDPDVLYFARDPR